jgi:hypothetical protein
MTIDTLEYVKKLEAAGVDRKAAEAYAEALRSAIEDELATRADIERLEAGTKVEVQKLESSTKAEIQKLESSTKAEIQKLESSTKTDIQRLESSTKAEIQKLESSTKTDIQRLEAKISEFKAETFKYMVAQTFVIIGVVFALMRFVR